MANLKRKHALVTGGAGLMGSQIVDLLCDEDCAEIVVFNNMVRGRWEHLEQAGAQGPVTLVQGDIRDGNLIASSVKAPDVVFHQTALRDHSLFNSKQEVISS